MTPAVSLSVVSHGQAKLVGALLRDLKAASAALPLHVTLTLNVPEDVPAGGDGPGLLVLRNERPRGFGANHNAAFRRGAAAPYFGVLNPDVRLAPDVLPRLVEALARRPRAAVVAPLVHGSDGALQDSARPLPTPWRILGKAMGLGPAAGVAPPDFVAGMFMLFRAEAFARLGGFDERYFLYYEDVDICCRARLAGLEVVQDRSVSVTHDGGRESHRRLRFLRWHLRSMARFFRSPVYRAARREAAS